MPWLDEVKNYSYGYPPYNVVSTNYFGNFTNGISLINASSTGVPNDKYLLSGIGDKFKLDSDKNYRFRHLLYHSSNRTFGISHFLSDETLYSRGAVPTILPNLTPDLEYDLVNPSPAGFRYYLTYYDSLSDRSFDKSVTYWFDGDMGDGGSDEHYIKDFSITECNFFVNGYKKFDDVKSSGWIMNTGVEEYSFKNNTASLPEQPIYKDSNFGENFIATKLKSNKTNISFTYDLTKNGSDKVGFYLIDYSDIDSWRSGSGTFSFGDYIPLEQVMSNVTGVLFEKVGLDTLDKYFVVRVENDLSTNNIDFNVRDIRIKGVNVIETGFTLSNGDLFSTTNLLDGSSKNVLEDPSFQTLLQTFNLGYSFEYDYTEDLTLNSYIGNGRFLSGVWENGVWNNGWRGDVGYIEFDDILNSYPVSNNKWRIQISRSSLLSSNELDMVGNEVSIGNIVVININEERKLLKNSYIIVEAKDNYIVVESEFIFPVRRIVKDSNKHKIRVSKNVWLSGAFLNGVFKGIWNDGLFKGTSTNSHLEDTFWIDGTFDGGRFKSEYPFTSNFVSVTTDEIDNITYAKISLNSSELISNSIIGSEVNITNSSNSYYDGKSVIINKDNDSITINREFIDNDNGSITLLISNGLIQNINFLDNNISKTISSKSLVSSSIYKYKSWLDVNYDDTEAVNIGRDLKVTDELITKNVSKNSLYGYPTFDILSSVSKFREPNTLNSKNYRLGSKYKIYTDFIGESSSFDEPFDTSINDYENFLSNGWTYSTNSISSSISFRRTDPDISLNVEGKELEIKSTGDGGVLENTKVNIEKNRYSIVEYDYVYNNDLISSIPSNRTKDLSILTSGFGGKNYPILNLGNLNSENRVDGTGTSRFELTYLPISKNLNQLKTVGHKKIEYFFNKKNLTLDIRGFGSIDNVEYFKVILDNLKFYEVDMIPFFKYFNENNIYKGVQIPLVGTSPYIDFSQNKYPFIENEGIPFDSIDIKPRI